MNEQMKILIAYDGSDCADAALDDLRRAGLPRVAEALVVSVADVFLPRPFNEELDNTFPMYVSEGVRCAHERAAIKLKEAAELAQRAGERVRRSFPGWTVRRESCAESPAWGVIWKASEFKADLIVAGAHGHSDFGGRLILGSVSQRILYEAPCSVRIARSRPATDQPVRIVLGLDGSLNSELTLTSVASRVWAAGTEVQLVMVLDTVMSLTPDHAQPEIVKWIEADKEEDVQWIRQYLEASAAKLRAAGPKATAVIKRGDPKRVLPDVAEEWKADAIFLGAKGVRGVERLMLGSVSSAVAARAHCSVEVVRSRPSSVPDAPDK